MLVEGTGASSADNLLIGEPGRFAVALPPSLRITQALALAESGGAVALLLSNASFLAEVAAISCAAALSANGQRSAPAILDQLHAGDRVWILPDAGVYVFDGPAPDGFWLKPIQVAAQRSAARFWVSTKEAWRLQPTSRLSPMGTPNKAAWAPGEPSRWDQLTGCRMYNNPALSSLAVVLVGERASFLDTLTCIGLAQSVSGAAASELDGLIWGNVEDDGDVLINSSSGALGEPIIALARTHRAAERLSQRNPDRSLLFISARATDAIADRSIVDQIAARHRFVLIVPPRRREDVLHLTEAGWLLIEPRHLGCDDTGVAQLDEVGRTSQWEERRPGILDQNSEELQEAFAALDRLGRALDPALHDEEDVAGVQQALRGAFFSVSDWLAAPDPHDLQGLEEAFSETHQRLRQLRSLAGDDAVAAAETCRAALDRFALRSQRLSMTPKGECVARLAEAAVKSPGYRQAIVVGHASAAARTSSFLAALGAEMPCLTPTGLKQEQSFSRLNILSMMRRETFSRLLDPWPAPDVMFLGYTHEVEIYRGRLEARERLRRRLAPDDDLCSRYPVLQRHRAPDEAKPTGSRPDIADPEPILTRPAKRPPAAAGEQLRNARVCRFAGQSWMAITPERTLTTVRSTSRGLELSSRSGDELETGDILLVRDGANPDVVREMAESIVGTSRYEDLRLRACVWSDQLRTAGRDVADLQKRLADGGVKRGLAALRHWLSDHAPIGPSEEEVTVPAIAAALGQNAADRRWKDCISAIRELRALHTRAGFSLTDALTQACGGSLVEHSDHETPILLPWGTVWLLEVESIEPSDLWPYTQINRLRWESESWRVQLLSRQILVSLAGEAA